ncbi:MAG: hypothetical protein LBK82_02665 [Planctomycetaceae bacterium]|nr:hypothetical protein [Planctomycetaceae bacterium]
MGVLINSPPLFVCFAGESKSVDFKQANSGDMSGSFAELKNVVTIASCRENEKSWLWGDAKHSLFTYWLIEAFKGLQTVTGLLLVMKLFSICRIMSVGQ